MIIEKGEKDKRAPPELFGVRARLREEPWGESVRVHRPPALNKTQTRGDAYKSRGRETTPNKKHHILNPHGVSNLSERLRREIYRGVRA